MAKSSASGVDCCLREEYGSCEGLPFYGEHEGKRYCVLHLPSKEKENDFKEALEVKLRNKNFNFGNAYFPTDPESFSWATFDKDVIFRHATFTQNSYFQGTTFKQWADFVGATFEQGANFLSATFERGADFSEAIFKGGATFNGTTFGSQKEKQEHAEKQESSEDRELGEEQEQRVALFEGVALFIAATFEQEVEFVSASFKRAALFQSTTFKQDATFSQTTFEQGANFAPASSSSRCTFEHEASFDGTTFKGLAYFPEAIFNGRATFSETTFEDAYFSGAIFKESAIFSSLKISSQTVFTFGDVTTERPERISFRTTHLRPSWFIDVDAQKFDFSDVEWFELPNGEKLSLEHEIKVLESRYIKQPQSLRKLTKACRKLMNNAEENRDYPAANEFHYWSMEAGRKESWVTKKVAWRKFSRVRRQLGPVAALYWAGRSLRRRLRRRDLGFRTRFGLIPTLYWALSGYGERPLRAFGVLVGMYAVFAVLYLLLPSSPFSVLSTSDVCEYLGCMGQAATYSLSALARILPAEPRLSPGLFQFIVTIEGLLGPLQIALFLLAVRRKVMR